MTEQLKNAVILHKEKLKSTLKRRGGYDDNLYYSVLHTSGEVSHKMSVVCFAALLYGLWSLEQDEHLEHRGPITHIILHKYGYHLTPIRHADKIEAYHAAVEAWCKLFDTFVELTEDAIIVDVRKGSVDCIGAFLVGFRNLGEQHLYSSFNEFLKHGFEPHQAAYLCQIWSFDEKTGWKDGGVSHRINEHSTMYHNIPTIFQKINSCVLFDKSHMSSSVESRVRLSWSLVAHFNQHNSSLPNVANALVGCGARVVGRDKFNYTTVTYNTEKFIKFLKEGIASV